MEASKRIVIIDDEQRMCDSLSALLEGDGYDVQAFQNSADAIRLMQKERVDLVVSDIKMPNITGLQVLEEVKKIDEGIPVILMTGYASMESAVDAISMGAYDYLMKPVEFSRFALVVKRALEKRQTELARLSLLEELKLSNMILNRRVGELNALYEAGKSIGSTANLKELLRQIISLAANVTEAQTGSIMLIDKSEKYLTIEAAIGLDEIIVAATRLPLGESIAGYVALSGEPIMIDDVEEDDKFKRINKERYGAASLLCIPLKIKNRVIGVINIANKLEGTPFSKNDLRLLSTFASQAAVAVDDANQFERNRRRLIEFQILHDVSNRASEIESLTEFRALILEKLVNVFPIDYSLWFNWDDDEQTLVPTGVSGVDDIPVTASGGVDIKKISRAILAVPAAEITALDFKDIDTFTKAVAKKISKVKQYPNVGSAFVAVPILRRGELAHIFCLGASSERPYSTDDISMARLVISQAALLMEKERSLLNATRLLTMGNMISEISHDLRKPLTSIKGGLQVIAKRWPEVMENSEFFQTVEDEVHRMNELVRELVDFSNPNKYQTEKADLRAIVGRAIDLVGPDLRKRKVKSETEFEDLNWDLFLNKNQILEVMLNLFLNAMDAMPDGGKLTIKGLIEKPAHKENEYLAIKISDTGEGIKKENISKIFDRYFTTKETGTGLGLAVVERIISAHDGTLAVESDNGNGTTFTLYFPYVS